MARDPRQPAAQGPAPGRLTQGGGPCQVPPPGTGTEGAQNQAWRLLREGAGPGLPHCGPGSLDIPGKAPDRVPPGHPPAAPPLPHLLQAACRPGPAPTPSGASHTTALAKRLLPGARSRGRTHTPRPHPMCGPGSDLSSHPNPTTPSGLETLGGSLGSRCILRGRATVGPQVPPLRLPVHGLSRGVWLSLLPSAHRGELCAPPSPAPRLPHTWEAEPHPQDPGCAGFTASLGRGPPRTPARPCSSQAASSQPSLRTCPLPGAPHWAGGRCAQAQGTGGSPHTPPLREGGHSESHTWHFIEVGCTQAGLYTRSRGLGVGAQPAGEEGPGASCWGA